MEKNKKTKNKEKTGNELNLLGKNLDVFPPKLNIFHTNPNDNLKNNCQPKMILDHAVFNYRLNQLFP